jgi:2-methylcitrate dehydratase PrpD
MTEWVTKKLASWAVNLRPEDLPDEVLAKAEDCIIDAIACAVPGSRADGARRIHSVAKSTFGKGGAVVWFGTERLHPTGAAFANAASASILDIDDGHRRALGHPGAAVVPTALATASRSDMRGIDVLANVVAGYEACIRIGMSEHRKAYHTGNWSGFGAAVAAGLSLGLTADQLMNALAVTAYHGPRVADLTLSQDMGTNVKESIPWSVVAGMMAADLAAQGFSGCRDALDIEERFAPTVALDGLDAGYFPASAEGRTSHAILRTYFKRYACCRWIHSAVEGLLEIMRERNLLPEEIQGIRVETFLQAASLNNLADPPTLESAQYSVPYCMGVAAALGENALTPLSADSLHHPPAIELAKKIKVQWVEEMDPDFPAKNPTRVIVTTASGTFDVLQSVPWGEPDRPPDRADLVGKFHSLARDRIPEDQVTSIVTAVEGLRDGMAQPLLDALAGC